jgi:ribosome-binding factor A
MNLRYSPELDVHLDHSMAYADHVDRILKNLPHETTE